MDIEQFYDADPRRRASDEIQFGREWTEGSMYFEVAWIADTGELYAMAEPFDRRGVSSAQVTVEILAVLEGRAVIDTVMAGWQDAMSGEDSLAWVRSRVLPIVDPTASYATTASTARRCAVSWPDTID